MTQDGACADADATLIDIRCVLGARDVFDVRAMQQLAAFNEVKAEHARTAADFLRIS